MKTKTREEVKEERELGEYEVLQGWKRERKGESDKEKGEEEAN